jgi:pimeloyl-ACP methyl ester carboxylesterase
MPPWEREEIPMPTDLLRRALRGARRGLLAILALTMLGGISGATWNAIRDARDRARFAPPGQRVDVGGLRLHLHCTGPSTGQPTVILESGFNFPALAWRRVQPELAKGLRVCSYDRAGLGYSDPERTRTPQTAAGMAQRLHTLLERAGVRRPLLLVGHSNGGYVVRSYYAQFPGDVVGAVLVDSSNEHMDEHFVGPNWEEEHRADQKQEWNKLWQWQVLRFFGGLRFILSRKVGDPGLHFPRELVDETVFMINQPHAQATMLSEADGIPATCAEMRAGRRLGDLPLLVLTAGKFQAPSLPPRGDYWNKLWVKDLQPELARLSSRGRQIVVDSGHMIPFEKPEAIVQAAAEVVAMAGAR